MILCRFNWLLPLVAFIVALLVLDNVVHIESFTPAPYPKIRSSSSPRIELSFFHLNGRPVVSTSVPVHEEIHYIAGRRAMLLHPATSKEQVANPPLVILGGMAQSIASWEFHLPHFAKHRSVLMYECLGQGPRPPETVCSNEDLDTYYEDVSLERQGRDFWNVVEEAFFTPGSYYYDNYLSNESDQIISSVDVVGFSFGGRVALAAAVKQPNRIRRLHLTGIGTERDEYANVLLASWKDMLNDIDADSTGTKDEINNPKLRAFAWSIILATYSEEFVASVGAARVQTWVDGVCKFNTQNGLREILLQTHDGEGRWTTASMAELVKGSVESYKLVVGSNDKLSSPQQVKRLAQSLGKQEDDKEDGSYRVVENCGHAVPFESMRIWREDVIKYLT